MPTPLPPVQALSFDSVAADYAAARPSYPPALLDAVEELSGHPLKGADVLEAGAGTGIATRLLRERGARVTALEPGPAMAAQLRGALPEVPLVRGSGDALPFAAGAFDLVAYAQSWHWTEPGSSVPEALRVLRPGGALALWWLEPDTRVPWIAEREARLAERCPAYTPLGIAAAAPGLIEPHAPQAGIVTRAFGGSGTSSIDERIRELSTHSWLAILGAGARSVLAEERAALEARFPGGEVLEAYVCRLVLALPQG